jgi:predicted LPLAT superfamily acyltransferase
VKRTEWLSRPERGSLILVRLLAWLTLRIGRSVARPFLYPICLYFMIFSRGTSAISRRFLERACGRPAGWRDVFRHYHAFASTIHDRVYLLAGRHHYFDIRTDGLSAVEPYLSRGQGCLLFGSHLGSFEVLRALGLFERNLPISVVMHEGAASKLNSVLHGLCPDIREHIIPPGTPDTMLLVKERLEQGDLVGILADRVLCEERTVTCPFLGKATAFPEGPFQLAALLQVPVVLFFGFYEGGRRYSIRFEPFADPLSYDRTRRSDSLREWICRYAARLEYHCRRYPYNWFNFYEYSDDATVANVAARPRVWAERT